MLDSLLFLPDDVDGAAVDVQLAAPPAAVPPAVAPATSGRDDAEAVAAVAATRDGHAHAVRGAWEAAGAALERAAVMRDGLVAAGLAGPVVAARGWSDLAAVRVASGDVDAARAAFARVRTATRGLPELPPDVAAAITELDAALGSTVMDASATVPAVTPPPARPTGEAPADMFATGLLWLDTTEDVAADAVPADAVPAASGDSPGSSHGSDATTAAARADAPVADAAPAAPAAPARITAIDDAVALAHAGGATRSGAGSLLSRLRRLLRS